MDSFSALHQAFLHCFSLANESFSEFLFLSVFPGIWGGGGGPVAEVSLLFAHEGSLLVCVEAFSGSDVVTLHSRVQSSVHGVTRHSRRRGA